LLHGTRTTLTTLRENYKQSYEKEKLKTKKWHTKYDFRLVKMNNIEITKQIHEEVNQILNGLTIEDQ
jgi:hypothetical protein